MNKAPISVRLSAGLLLCGLGAVAVAQTTSAAPARRVSPSGQATLLSRVHITPSNLQPGDTSIQIGSDTWVARGFDLKTLIAQIYNVDLRLVDLPGNGNNARYDLSVSLPRDLDQDEMQHLLVAALERKFNVEVVPEKRSMDVYVISAPTGPGAALHRHTPPTAPAALATLVSQDSEESSDAPSQITFMGKDCSGVSSGGITVSAGTISDFRRTLEPDLDRVLLDETSLTGSYDFRIGNYTNTSELFKLLYDQLGLVVTPAKRQVTVLAVHPSQSLQAQL